MARIPRTAAGPQIEDERTGKRAANHQISSILETEGKLDMHVSAAAWAFTLALIAGLLAFDWLLHGRRPHQVSFGEAICWSLFYIAVAVLFGVGFALIAGWDLGTQFFAGYLVEKSLS